MHRRHLALLDELDARGLLDLVDDLCRRRGVLRRELLGRHRTRGVVRARHELWWLLRHDPERTYSLPELARLFDRDHTTILAGVAAHASRQRCGTSPNP